MRFSSIIPTLNEETRIGQLIRYLSWVAARADEILVVDGGSSDVTRAEAALAGASQVLSSMRSGRSAPDFFEQIETARAAGCDCGCLRLRFERPPPLLRLHAWLVRWHWRMVRFGDQSLYVS